MEVVRALEAPLAATRVSDQFFVSVSYHYYYYLLAIQSYMELARKKRHMTRSKAKSVKVVSDSTFTKKDQIMVCDMSNGVR